MFLLLLSAIAGCAAGEPTWCLQLWGPSADALEPMLVALGQAAPG